jgi:hypothetical protein
MKNTLQTCAEIRKQMPEAYYGELTPVTDTAFRKHLESCPACAGEFSRMEQTLGAMKRFSPADPGDEFWSRWNRELDSRIDAAAHDHRHPASKIFAFRPAHIPGWAYGIAALLLVTVGIYLGRIFYPAPAPPQSLQNSPAKQTTAANLPEDSTSQIAMQYIERSRNVLLGIINSDDDSTSPAGIGQQQRISRELVQQAAVLKTALNQPDQQRLRQLIQDLEVILIQLANVEVRPGVPIVEMVKQGVDKRSILLKINCEELKAQSRKPDPAVNNPKSHL